MANQMLTIGDIAEIFDGPHATPKKIENGPYFLSISSLEDGRLDLSKSAHVSEEQFVKWTKRVTPQKGDLLFSYETRLGEAALMPEGVRACLGRRMGLLRPKLDKVIPEYLLYAYISPFFQQVIKANTIVGATVDRISLSEMKDFPIRIPNLSEQKAACLLLSTIDKKIELNNRINSELEAMAKTLYDYWFVQFDFPDVNGKPYKASGGKMVYNPVLKREIPANWKVQPITDCCEVVDCLHSKKPGQRFVSPDYFLLQLENIRDDGLVDVTTKYFVSQEDYSIWTSRIEVKRHDVVMTNAGRIAAFAQIPSEVKCGIGRNITAIRPYDIGPNYFFSCLSGFYIQSQILTNLDHGAFFKSFNVKGIKALNIIRPPSAIEGKFEQLISPLIEKRQSTILENQKLTSLRDWLLPMLMNGQVTVKPSTEPQEAQHG
ncbi:restriction endonuclease subunit S [Vibrio cholerae]|uniref:restriction endonuclease subunit S n=1 Tax=Vibrio cholerae TaxID=666 RepID=UPI001DBC927E|nr:restriction endonuclease subunit S [Vibrio cholerae]GIB03948.1 Restriction modification system DNA specificity domain protein [Vibrio cholerae]